METGEMELTRAWIMKGYMQSKKNEMDITNTAGVFVANTKK